MARPSPVPPGTPALVTGASSGIGQAFARRLAAAGQAPILVARRTERLGRLAEELRKTHGVNACALTADLARPEDLARVCAEIEAGPALGSLIHAAGFGTRGHYAEVASHKHTDMIQLHNLAAAQLTRAALPAMLASGRGDLVFVSSLAAFFTTAHYVTYSATKAFLNTFVEGLAAELRGRGLRVQALCAGLTRTGFLETEEYRDFAYEQVPDLFWMTPEAVVDESLRALRRGRVIHVAGRTNRLFVRAMHTPGLGRLLRHGLAALS